MSVPTVSSIFSPAAAAVQTVETSSGRGGHLSADLDPVDL